MRILGFNVSIRVRIGRAKDDSEIKIDPAFQKKVLGSSSQYFEDIFIDSIFRGKAVGRYIDIGANDPSELNNTKRFYERGWSGVNVEPNVTLYGKICRERPRDINLNMGIGLTEGDLTFFELSPDTLSTFNEASALRSVKKDGARIVSKTRVKVISLAELIRSTFPDPRVDFISVDAEGYEYEILSSNDWKLYRPTAVVVELNQDRACNSLNLLKNNGYMLVYHNGTNGIFVDKESPEIMNCSRSKSK